MFSRFRQRKQQQQRVEKLAVKAVRAVMDSQDGNRTGNAADRFIVTLGFSSVQDAAAVRERLAVFHRIQGRVEGDRIIIIHDGWGRVIAS